MALVPFIGLSPFFLYHLSIKDNIFKVIFLRGIFIGSIPTCINLYFSYRKFGNEGITYLFEFAKSQAIGEFDFSNLLILPLNFIYFTFPVGIILLCLFAFNRINNTAKYPLLIYCYPFLSLVILLCMSTSYPHYYLFLLPSLSMLFAVNINSNLYRFSFSKFSINYFLLLLIIFITIILLAFILYYNNFLVDHSSGHTLIVYIIASFFLLSYIVSIGFLIKNRFYHLSLINFFYTIAIPQYFLISALFNLGILGSPNLNTKLFLSDESVSPIVRSNTICLFEVDSKNQTLLQYYLPSSKVVNNVTDISNCKYLITSNVNILDTQNFKSLFRSIKKVDNQILLMNMSK